MSGKGEYFLVRNIRSLLGAEVLFSVKVVFGESVPGSPSTPAHSSPGRLALTVAGRRDLRMSSRDCPCMEWRVVIFSHPEPVEAFQRLFNI